MVEMAFVPGCRNFYSAAVAPEGLSACVVVVESAAELGLGAFAAQAGQHHRDAEEQDSAGDGADDEELGSIVDAQRLAEQGRAAYRVVVFLVRGSFPGRRACRRCCWDRCRTWKGSRRAGRSVSTLRGRRRADHDLRPGEDPSRFRRDCWR